MSRERILRNLILDKYVSLRQSFRKTQTCMMGIDALY